MNRIANIREITYPKSVYQHTLICVKKYKILVICSLLVFMLCKHLKNCWLSMEILVSNKITEMKACKIVAVLPYLDPKREFCLSFFAYVQSQAEKQLVHKFWFADKFKWVQLQSLSSGIVYRYGGKQFLKFQHLLSSIIFCNAACETYR